MGRSIGRLTEPQREAIYDLKREGKSGLEIQKACALGYKDLPPFSVSPHHANAIARRLMDERNELYDKAIQARPVEESIERLARRLLGIADREVNRLDRAQRQGRLDGRRVANMATALTRLQALADRIEEGKASGANGDGEPRAGGDVKKSDAPKSSWIAQAVANGDGEDDTSEPTPAPAPVGDVRVGANGGSFAPTGRTRQGAGEAHTRKGVDPDPDGQEVGATAGDQG